MYKYAIWQMKNDPELTDYRFMTWTDSNPRPTAPVAHACNYNKLYEGEIEDCNVSAALEQLFYIFNVERPEDFRGHSLSVSDVVELDGRFFYCNALGWRHVEDFKQNKTIEGIREDIALFIVEFTGYGSGNKLPEQYVPEILNGMGDVIDRMVPVLEEMKDGETIDDYWQQLVDAFAHAMFDVCCVDRIGREQ